MLCPTRNRSITSSSTSVSLGKTLKIALIEMHSTRMSPSVINLRWHELFCNWAIINLLEVMQRFCYPDLSNKVVPHLYNGTLNTTVSGLACQRWDSQTPHIHSMTAGNFPDDTIGDAANNCRDPDESGYIWCYTMDPTGRWEKCVSAGSSLFCSFSYFDLIYSYCDEMLGRAVY